MPQEEKEMLKRTLIAGLGLVLCASAQASVTYQDTVGDLFDNGLGNLDITSVDVSHDEGNVYMSINLNADIASANWGKYLIAINAFDDGTGSNPWGRNIDFGGEGIDRFIGSWADGGGGALGYHHFTDWYEQSGVSVDFSDASSGAIHYTISRDWLGAPYDSFKFDVMTSGGSSFDPGVDHLSRSDQATGGWGETSYSGDFLVYDLPAPGALVLLGLAGIMRSRRRH